jgi:hypothetical protein
MQLSDKEKELEIVVEYELVNSWWAGFVFDDFFGNLTAKYYVNKAKRKLSKLKKFKEYRHYLESKKK